MQNGAQIEYDYSVAKAFTFGNNFVWYHRYDNWCYTCFNYVSTVKLFSWGVWYI